MSQQRSCFAFYSQNSVACTQCPVMRRCRSITWTHGADILADTLTHLLENLPQAQYTDTASRVELVRQLRDPPTAIAIGAADAAGIDEIDPDILI